MKISLFQIENMKIISKFTSKMMLTKMRITTKLEDNIKYFRESDEKILYENDNQDLIELNFEIELFPLGKSKFDEKQIKNKQNFKKFENRYVDENRNIFFFSHGKNLKI
jgi:hypothetical protein